MSARHKTTDPSLRNLFRKGLAARRGDVERNAPGALLDALELCVLVEEPVPSWLRAALGGAINRYRTHDVRTLDEAFNVRRPAGYRRKAAQAAGQHGLSAEMDITHLAIAGAAIDDALFEAVASRYGVGKTTVKKWYYGGTMYVLAQSLHGTGSRSDLPSRLDSLADQVNWKA